ncbi:hypothetical protein BHM03_00007430 [Ensete ventricosum]|nr:hypothetical protein BHM03_00007430 [Ensete ventricosum]
MLHFSEQHNNKKDYKFKKLMSLYHRDREDIDFLLPTTRLQGTATFCWSASSSARSILHAAATAFGDHGLPSILSRLVTELFGLWFGDTGDIRSL